jgi:hypothetical protein
VNARQAGERTTAAAEAGAGGGRTTAQAAAAEAGLAAPDGRCRREDDVERLSTAWSSDSGIGGLEPWSAAWSGGLVRAPTLHGREFLIGLDQFLAADTLNARNAAFHSIPRLNVETRRLNDVKLRFTTNRKTFYRFTFCQRFIV